MPILQIESSVNSLQNKDNKDPKDTDPRTRQDAQIPFEPVRPVLSLDWCP